MISWSEMLFVTSHINETLFNSLLIANIFHGGHHIVAEDIERKPITYSN